MVTWAPGIPFNDLPPPPGIDVVETIAVLKAAIAANSAVAQLNQAANSIPNPTILINAIPILEAQASSEIENIVTTTDDLFRHLEDSSGADPSTKETLRYRTALRAGYEQTLERGLSIGTATLVCSMIKNVDMGIRSIPGTRIANPTTGDLVYSPPEGQDLIAKKLHIWEEFIHADDGMDALVKMAVAHYQFEAIHPFTDGNGRTGRILNVLMLVEAGLLTQPLLYLSGYIIKTKSDYYRLLQQVSSDGLWEPWILYILEGIRESSLATVKKIEEIRALQVDFGSRAREFLRGTSDSVFLSVLFEQPYSRIGTVMERCEVSRPTATSWLNLMVTAGLLHDIKTGRDRLFVNTGLLAVLQK